MSKKYLIIAIISLVLIFGGIGLWWFLGQDSIPEETVPVPNPVVQKIETNTGVSEVVSKEVITTSGSGNLLSKMNSPDGTKRFELYSDQDSCECYSRAQCSISIVDIASNTEIERLNSIQQGPCPVFPTGGTPIKWYDDGSLVVNSGFGDSGASGNEFSVYNLTEKKTTQILWKQSGNNFQNPPITILTFGDKTYYFQSNKDNITIYELASKNVNFIINDEKDPEKYTLDYAKLVKKATLKSGGELSIIPDYTGIYFNIGDLSYQFDPETSKIDIIDKVFSPSQVQEILAKIDENAKKQAEISKNATGVLVQGDFRAEYDKSINSIKISILGEVYKYPVKNGEFMDIYSFSPSGNYLYYRTNVGGEDLRAIDYNIIDIKTGNTVLTPEQHGTKIGLFLWTQDRKQFIYSVQELDQYTINVTIKGAFPKVNTIDTGDYVISSGYADNYNLYTQGNLYDYNLNKDISILKIYDLNTLAEVFSQEIK